MARKKKQQETVQVPVTDTTMPPEEGTIEVNTESKMKVKDDELIIPDQPEPAPIKKVYSSRGARVVPQGEYLDCRVVVLESNLFERSKREILQYDVYMNSGVLMIKDRAGHVICQSTHSLNYTMKALLHRMWNNNGQRKDIKYSYHVL